MEMFNWILLLLLGAVVLTTIAARIGAPYPALLALGGAAVALLPVGVEFRLDPHLALALFVAPVLLDAAFDTSTRDLRANWRPIVTLVIGAVFFTTLAVALVAKVLVPGMGWAVAIALGAIVAPPDAAAATAVLRQVNLPHRLLVILEGESLFNDATALLVYRLAVAAAMGTALGGPWIAPMFLLVVIGSGVAGWALAWVAIRIVPRVDGVPASIVLQFVTTFGVWILAEDVGLSGILTVVVYGICLGRQASKLTSARHRIPSYAVWETVVFVMNVLAFLLIGLQLKPIWQHLNASQRRVDIGIAVAVLLTVFVARFACVFAYKTLLVRLPKWFGSGHPVDVGESRRGGLLLSWCGMRGIVTLAAALALPDAGRGNAFPNRDLLIVCAFTVVLGTLLLQGFTLRPLLARLNLHDDRPVEREFNEARRRLLQSAVDALRSDASPIAASVRREYEMALQESAEKPDDVAKLPGDELRRRALVASRKTLADLRDTGQIGVGAFQRLEERLDRVELTTEG